MKEYFKLLNAALKRMWSENYEKVLDSLLKLNFTEISTKSQYIYLLDSLLDFWGESAEKMFARLGEIIGESFSHEVSKNVEGTKSDKFHVKKEFHNLQISLG